MASPPGDHGRGGTITAAIVTYGDRGRYLGEVLAALAASRPAVQDVVVVLNGPCGPSTAAALDAAQGHGVRLDVAELPDNGGSASGFAAAVRRALASGSEWIWLLDDDNAPAPDALELLLAESAGREDIAVAGYRPPQYAGLRLDAAGRQKTPRSGFLGMHWSVVIDRMLRRLSTAAPAPLPDRVELQVAPYGGLLVPVALVERVGLPDERFVLYADDTEFTSRIRREGGRIVLVVAARIDDVDRSWNATKEQLSGFRMLLDAGHPFQVYYSVRNNAYLSRHLWRDAALPYAMHKLLFLALLAAAAFPWPRQRRTRLKLVLEAIREGERAQLGRKPGIALPG